jgi:hypothetical protein
MYLEKNISGYGNLSYSEKLSYEIVESYNSEFKIKEYGLCACLVNNNSNQISKHIINAITPNKEKIKLMINYLFDNSIKPNVVRDVIDDLLLV